MTGLNIYRRSFSALCPNNGEAISYSLEITHTEMIMAEKLVEATIKLGEEFHEALADRLFTQFGGAHVLRAHHHGVDIETIRGVF